MRAILTMALGALVAFSAWADDEEKVALDKLSKAVVDAVKARFPKAELVSATKETEDKKTTYEVTIKDGKTTIDVDVTAEGVITGMEKEIAVVDLPKEVAATVTKEHPKSKAVKAEEVIQVKDGKEKLAYYEVTVEEGDKRIEVEVLPDGKLKPAEKKEEKKDKQ